LYYTILDLRCRWRFCCRSPGSGFIYSFAILKSLDRFLKPNFFELHYEVNASASMLTAGKAVEPPLVKRERGFVFLWVVERATPVPLLFSRTFFESREAELSHHRPKRDTANILIFVHWPSFGF
jgi:hypothetical protein